jgi:nucleotide-binding universal stress UspA family protein
MHGIYYVMIMCAEHLKGGKILVPVDGSDGCNKALSYALDLSKRYGASVHLIHVVQHSATLIAGPMDETIGYSMIDDALEESGKRSLENCSKEAEKQGVKVNTTLLRGHPGTQIVKFAEDEGFDLIVMGSRGLSGLKRLILGSVSDYVSDNAECSVLIVK